MQTAIYNIEGKEVGTIELPEKIFNAKRNSVLVHQVVTSLAANARPSVAHTKGRGEVRGGGKKPWRQKGTGRARHGSSRSPIWRGGGTTHGPRTEKDYSKKINRAMAAQALAVVLSDKHRAEKLVFVDALDFKTPKTKDARGALTGIGGAPGMAELKTRRTNAALIALPAKSRAVEKSFQNMGNVSVTEVRNMTAADVLKYRFVVLVAPKEGVAELEKRLK